MEISDTVSLRLAHFLIEKSHCGVVITPVADAIRLEVLSDRNLNGFTGLLDEYYVPKGFNLAPLASTILERFALRTYRHLSGSSTQIMVSETAKYNYFVFINDYEDSRQREIRGKLRLPDELAKQEKGHN